MKPHKRGEKRRIIEKAKTIVLVLLLLSCLFLAYRVFDIYHDQTTSNIQQTNIVQGRFPSSYGNLLQTDSSLSLRQSLSPELVLANSIYGRYQIPQSSQDFSKISEVLYTSLQKFYSAKEDNWEEVSFNEWKVALSGNSIYARFPSQRFFSYEASVFGSSSPRLSSAFQSYSDLILIPDSQGSLTILFRALGNRILKTRLDDAENTIGSIISKHSNEDSYISFAFAYELNLDSANSGRHSQLDSMVLIPVQDIESPEISITVPRFYKSFLNITKPTEFTNGLIRIFGYNPNTVRQYTNSKGSLIFVGETGSLSISPDGNVKYKALDSGDGIAFSATDSSRASIVTGICGIIQEILDLSGIKTQDSDFEILISKMPDVNATETEYSLFFDYFINGSKVAVSSGSSISAYVKNNKLSEFEMTVRDIESKNTSLASPNIIQAIDSFCTLHPDVRTIKKANLIYDLNSDSDSPVLNWYIQGE